MKCHIPGPNVKVFGRTVHALARFGDELYLESLTDCIVLSALNNVESAYAKIKFGKAFFSYFNHNYYSTDDKEGLKCIISMKSALHTFKSPAHMDKQVENLEIKLDPDACKLIFLLRCKHGIVKTHYVSILNTKSIDITYQKDSVPNRITSHHKILAEALGSFQSSDDHVTIEATSQSLLLRNYVDSTGDYTKLIRTQISLQPAEFDSYTIGTDTTITFTLKEFRALLTFAEALNLPLQLHFETTGKPAVFIIHNGCTLEAHFVVATSKDSAQEETAPNTMNVEHNKTKEANVRNVTMSNVTKDKNVERIKRKETMSNDSVKKRAHLDTNVSKCLNEESHLFNFVDLPLDNNNDRLDNSISLLGNVTGVNIGISDNNMDCDNIPASPMSINKVKCVFKRCFELTFDPRTVEHVVFADNSDSE